MAKPNKKKLLIEWMKKVKANNAIHNRQFFDSCNFYNFYLQTKSPDDLDFTFSSFKRLVDSICDENAYQNLKRKINKRIKGIQYKRKLEYIIVEDCEKDLNVDDIKVYIT